MGNKFDELNKESKDLGVMEEGGINQTKFELLTNKAIELGVLGEGQRVTDEMIDDMLETLQRKNKLITREDVIDLINRKSNILLENKRS